MPTLLTLFLTTFVSEDLACIAAGVLIAKGELGFLAGTAACLAGIAAGDLGLFFLGRLAGAQLLQRSWMRRWLPAQKVEAAGRWLTRRGLAVVFLSRFTPGLRLPTYFAAGLTPTPARAFVVYFMAAAAIWTPVLVGAASLLGEQTLQLQLRGFKALAFLAVGAVALRYLLGKLGALISWRGLGKLWHWEFWPAWAAYLPVVPYVLYLGLRHRGLTVFTASNPGIPGGGLMGESKSRILGLLSRRDGVVPEFAVIAAGGTTAQRLAAARGWMTALSLDWPVVLKPDVGERGDGVAVVRSEAEVEAYLAANVRDTLIQRYAEGIEYGVFYVRYPREAKGRIVSITEKRFPVIVGDGQSSLRELIEQDRRASLLASTYERLCRRPMDDVPGEGEHVQLVEIGSHCRGAIFVDATALNTPALEQAIDAISQSHPGFYFGRFDLRAPSAEALRRGEQLRVLELNGVASEATHIYDPAVSLLEAYRTMFRLWRTAFEIGAQNRDMGSEVISLRGLWSDLARCRKQRGKGG